MKEEKKIFLFSEEKKGSICEARGRQGSHCSHSHYGTGGPSKAIDLGSNRLTWGLVIAGDGFVLWGGESKAGCRGASSTHGREHELTGFSSKMQGTVQTTSRWGVRGTVMGELLWLWASRKEGLEQPNFSCVVLLTAVGIASSVWQCNCRSTGIPHTLVAQSRTTALVLDHSSVPSPCLQLPPVPAYISANLWSCICSTWALKELQDHDQRVAQWPRPPSTTSNSFCGLKASVTVSSPPPAPTPAAVLLGVGSEKSL